MHNHGENVILFFPENNSAPWVPWSYMSIAPALADAGFTPIVIDQRVQGNWKDILTDNLGDAIWMGISLMAGHSITNGLEVARFVKEQRADLPLVYGGAWPTVAPKITLKHPYVDFVVSGAGEQIAVSLTNYFLGKHNALPAGVYSKEQLNSLSDSYSDSFEQMVAKGKNWRQAYDLIPDINLYRSENNVASLFSSSGCAYGKCTFCAIIQPYKYNPRTPEDVVDEISFLVNEKKFRYIFFLDGLFFVNRSATVDLVRAFEGRFQMEWKARVRSDSLSKFTSQELNLFRGNGLKVVATGFESGSNRMLEHMKKGVKAEDAFKLVTICRDYGIDLQASFLFGIPGERLDDLKLTLDHIEKIKSMAPTFYPSHYFLVPIPGAQTFREFVETGGEVPSTLEEWGEVMWEVREMNKLHWLNERERSAYLALYHDYFGAERRDDKKEEFKGFKQEFQGFFEYVADSESGVQC